MLGICTCCLRHHGIRIRVISQSSSRSLTGSTWTWVCSVYYEPLSTGWPKPQIHCTLSFGRLLSACCSHSIISRERRPSGPCHPRLLTLSRLNTQESGNTTVIMFSAKLQQFHWILPWMSQPTLLLIDIPCNYKNSLARLEYVDRLALTISSRLHEACGFGVRRKEA